MTYFIAFLIVVALAIGAVVLFVDKGETPASTTPAEPEDSKPTPAERIDRR